MIYTPNNPPQLDSVEHLRRYVHNELLSISAAMPSSTQGVIHTPPRRPFEGQIALADGTNWNPGGGKGFYGYHSGAWHKLES